MALAEAAEIEPDNDEPNLSMDRGLS